jgi:hypothetical protein
MQGMFGGPPPGAPAQAQTLIVIYAFTAQTWCATQLGYQLKERWESKGKALRKLGEVQGRCKIKPLAVLLPFSVVCRPAAYLQT